VKDFIGRVLSGYERSFCGCLDKHTAFAEKGEREREREGEEVGSSIWIEFQYRSTIV
jgi:hypothetical protein